MALRQREWVIFIRPYHKRSSSGISYKIDYDGTPMANRSALGYTGSSSPMALNGAGEGGGETDKGGWVMWLKTSSFKHLREKYKELLKDTPVQHIRVTELINVDTMITPIS